MDSLFRSRSVAGIEKLHHTGTTIHNDAMCSVHQHQIGVHVVMPTAHIT
jgi:hypothetical protein